MNLLHVTYDLRDRLNREKTSAVRNLINLSEKFSDSSVIDLLRVPYIFSERKELKTSNHLLINSFGLPYGLFFRYSQNHAIEKIHRAQKSGLFSIKSTHLIHSHKLTFDGFVGYHLAIDRDVPLIVTLRQTDTMVFNRKPGLIKYFRPVIEKCEKIIYLIPQITYRLKEKVGDELFEKHIKDKLVFLPNVVERKIENAKKDVKRGNFVTVLRMNKESVVRKNIKRLLLAFKELNDKDLKLKIIGTGDYMYKVQNWVDEFKLKDKIIFVGQIDNNMIDEHYASAEAFLLPSISESFGMVYAEALMNGTPIMYSKNRLGFDGVFDDVGAGVDPLSVKSIAEGIINLLSNSTNYRKRINELDKDNAFEIFSSQYISQKYEKIINSVTG
jgi:glycosyltransferase involved in cell wall biosynthesis